MGLTQVKDHAIHNILGLNVNSHPLLFRENLQFSMLQAMLSATTLNARLEDPQFPSFKLLSQGLFCRRDSHTGLHTEEVHLDNTFFIR